MRGLPLALAAGLALAGCLSPASRTVTPEDGVPADDTRGEDELWVVWVHGREWKDRGALDSRAVCSIVFDHELNASAKTLRLGERYADWAGARIAIAFDQFDDGDCPLAYEVHFDKTRVAQAMGQAGTVAIDVFDANGTALLDGATWIRAGQRVTVSYDARDGWRGEYTVENLGAWPRSALSRA